MKKRRPFFHLPAYALALAVPLFGCQESADSPYADYHPEQAETSTSTAPSLSDLLNAPEISSPLAADSPAEPSPSLETVAAEQEELLLAEPLTTSRYRLPAGVSIYTKELPPDFLPDCKNTASGCVISWTVMTDFSTIACSVTYDFDAGVTRYRRDEGGSYVEATAEGYLFTRDTFLLRRACAGTAEGQITSFERNGASDSFTSAPALEGTLTPYDIDMCVKAVEDQVLWALGIANPQAMVSKISLPERKRALEARTRAQTLYLLRTPGVE